MLHLRNFKTLKLDFRNFVLFIQSGARQLVLMEPILYVIHQNTILACHSLNLNYKDLIRKVVCDNTNKLCMIHHCPNCPEKNNLIEYLYQIIPDNTEEEINF